MHDNKFIYSVILSDFMIRNKTKNKIIAKKARITKNILLKARGLMFSSRKAVKNRALVFEFVREQRVGLHMIFVFYPIDVIFLNEKKRVVETTTLKPFCPSYVPKKRAKYVVECEQGTIERSKTKIGDVLRF